MHSLAISIIMFLLNGCQSINRIETDIEKVTLEVADTMIQDELEELEGKK